MHFLYNNVLVYNVNIKPLKTLKTLQHVSIYEYNQIIFRELVVSSLKALSLEFLKI